MEDSFIFRGKVPDDKHRLKIWLNGQCNLLKFLTISCLDNQCIEKSLIYYFV